MKRDTILIIEYTTAGGLVEGRDRAADISIEGFAMVKALVTDAIAGNFDVHLVLQESMDYKTVLAGMSVTVHPIMDSDDLKIKFEEIAPEMDYCFLVAPEFDHILLDLTRFLESLNCHLLSQPSIAILDASDKKRSLDRLVTGGVHVPRSQAIDEFLQSPAFPYPVVVKPVHGAGSIGVYKAQTSGDLKAAMSVDALLKLPEEELLVQEFIVGEQLSASVIATKDACCLLGINEQRVLLQSPSKNPSKYTGGVVGPIHPELRETCTSIATAIAGIFSLDGYFGFDFILDEHGEVVVVEINPRLTTSFVGLKKLYETSILRFVANSSGVSNCEELVLRGTGFASYKIVERSGIPDDDAWSGIVQQVDGEHDVVMMAKNDQVTSFFITGIGLTRQEALDTMQEFVDKLSS